MCVPGCHEAVVRNLSRRAFIGSAAAAAALSGCRTLGGNATASADEAPRATHDGGGSGRTAAKESTLGRASSAGSAPTFAELFSAFSRVVDLTHTYSAEFPHFRGTPSIVKLDAEASTANGDGWNVFQWTIDEHAGTHIDAPFHRNADGWNVAEIPARDLVLPLAIVDIRDRARTNPDAELTLDDLRRWEAEHGPLPERGCVALFSGWDARADGPGFINLDGDGVRHFPGFHIEAIEFVVEERNIAAIATDTASFDHGPTTEFPCHTLWLGRNRWALENVARLGDVPPAGATIVCGAPKVAGASGGPSRVFALV